ncbi:MAG: 2OG-Fe(II) oxygenase [Rhodospirillaceae bacterium]
MQRATLRLRDGGRVPCVVPQDEATARDVGLCVHAPAQVAEGLMLRLQSAEGAPIELKAREVVGIEMDPPYVLLRNFLSEQDAERAMAHALAHEAEFRDSTVAHVDHLGGYATDTRLRRSRILDNVADVAPMIGRRLYEVMPRIFQSLGMAPIPFRNVEMQLSAHGDGDFFNTHTDNGLPEIAHRTMSYVYYFHREPKRFTGGHLRLYRTVIHEGVHSAGDLVADIDPPRNGLMVFPSYIQHEVSPISCPSSALADQRLTLNGWLVA